MKINVHAGHNPDGKVGCGAVGILYESTQNRIVKDHVIKMLRELGNEVYDCTVDDGTSARDVLQKIVAKCNSHSVDLDVSIHHNAFRGIEESDGKIKGSEVYTYSSGSKAKSYAESVLSKLVKLGFTNRGVQSHPELYVLKHTNAPAMLIECCFVDDPDDVRIYNAYDVAVAIVEGIVGHEINCNNSGIMEPTEGCTNYYKVQVGAFTDKRNAEAMLNEIKSAGYDAFIQPY